MYAPFGHFVKEICLLVFLDRNGQVCLCARGCWWSSGTMMWAEIPIHPQWTQANTFLETVLSAGVVTVPLSRWEKVPVESWSAMVLGTGRKAHEELWLCSQLEADPLFGSLPGLGVHTPALQEHHVRDPCHMGTSHRDPGRWAHPRTSIQPAPRRHSHRIPGPVTLRWAQ